jgi:hypothetical protein
MGKVYDFRQQYLANATKKLAKLGKQLIQRGWTSEQVLAFMKTEFERLEKLDKKED